MAVNWNEISNKIVIEGEAEYKKSMANINRALREAKSEMKAAAAEYDANSDSIDALKASMDALQNVEQGQNLALATMEKHLKRVEETTGESSREAVELRTKINNLRAEITRTNSDLSRFEQMMNDARDAMEDVDKSADGIGNDLKQIGSGAADAEDDVGGLADELNALGGIGLGDVAGKLGGIAGVGATLGAALTLSNETIESWNQLSAYTGATGDTLEALKADAQAVYESGIVGSLGEATQAVAQVYQQTGLTGTSLQNCTEYALALSDTFGMDVSESARTAAQMMETFGITGEEAYDLITVGAQNGADKNGNLLDTINEYSPYFEAAGKDAEDMFNAIITGAQNGVYDVDKIGDSWKEFMLRVANDEGAKEALKDLGFEATDVRDKIAEGGPAADLATQMIIDALARVQDPYEQNRLGIALFGTQWEDTAGAVLPAFDNMETGLDDVAGAAQRLFDLKTDDFEAQWTGMIARIGAKFAEHFTPHVTQATALITGVNYALDGEGSVAEGAALSLQSQYEGEVQGLMEKHNLTREGATILHIKGIRIDSEGAETDELVEWVKGLYGEAETEADTQGGILGESVVETETTAINDGLPDAEKAGHDLVDSTTLGFEDGQDGMYAAGADSADSLVSGLETGISGAYSAGHAAGSAYARGYKDAQDQHSPSRVMKAAAHDTVDGLLTGFEEDERRMQEAGAALAAAVSGGYGDPPLGSAGASYGANSGSGGDTVAALREALSGMGIYMKGEKIGELCEMGVSRAQTRRAMNTVSGLSTATKAW